MSSDTENTSPYESQPTSPGFQSSEPTSPGFQTTEQARNVAVDYIKARYEGGVKPKDAPSANVPKVFREPKKLDFQWDKIVDDTAKKETGIPAGFKEQDLMVFTCMGVDTKSQYLSAIDSQQPSAKDEKSMAEIESLPEITKSVRKMFESGNIIPTSDRPATESNEEIQRGNAKSLLSQWSKIETEGTASITSGPPPTFKPTYELVAGSGVFENEPTVLDGVVRASDQTSDQVIQRGLTRSLLGQWNNIGQDAKDKPAKPGLATLKSTYETAPGSGVFENEPTRLDGVARENDSQVEGEQIHRGSTKSLLNQWQNKGVEEPNKYPSRRPIRIAEAEGRIAENEPVHRTDVVRADDAPAEIEKVRRGHAKSLVNEWKTKGNEEFFFERKTINVAEGEGQVIESEPIRRTDVVREDDSTMAEGEQIQRGTTKMLLDQWKNINTNSPQYSSKERTPIVLHEGEERVVENAPAPRRNDVARENDDGPTSGNQIQRGMARSLMNQWNSIGSVSDIRTDRKERTPINVNEAEGKVLENEPVRRADVVRADDDSFEEVKIQRGTTQNLLSQWKNKANDEYRVVKKSIILNEDEGRIAENEPEARLTDDCAETECEQVEKGLAKNRLCQWQNKASEPFVVGKKQIILAEGDGYVAENEPQCRTDVIREDDGVEEKIQRGLTKSLLSQWNTIGTEEVKQPKRKIVVAEGEEQIVENEPVRRTDVVHADDTISDSEPKVRRGATKSLLSQWNTKGTSDVPIERKAVVIAEDEGRVLESEPIRLEGVIRGDDNVSIGEVVQRGTTRSLLEQWKNKPNEESPRIERRPIVLAETEGTVAENEPEAPRGDVVRSSESVLEERVVERGFARSLRDQWSNKSAELESCIKERTPIVLNEAEGRISENEPIHRTDVVRADNDDEPKVQKGTTRSLLNRWSGADFNAETHSLNYSETRKPIVIAEDEGCVIENQPVRRNDVVHADDEESDRIPIRRGLARSLADEWKNKGTEEFVVERKKIDVCEGEGSVAENEPMRRGSDVVREVDDDFDEHALIQKGLTKSLLGQWNKIGTEEIKIDRKPIVVAEGEGKVLENNPVRRDDVVHCDDVDSVGETVQKGLTKNLLNQWTCKGNQELVRERKAINVAEDDGKVAENEPAVRADVFREHGDFESVKIKRGTAKTLVDQWKHKSDEEFIVEKRPIVLAEVEGRVVENEPLVRSDLVRENDGVDDVKIQRGLAKSLANQWKHKGEEEFKMERAPIVVAEGEGSVAESTPMRREGVVREEDVVDEWETVQRGEGTVSENEPVHRSDVVREGDLDFRSSLADLPPRGQTRNLRAQWSSISITSSDSSRDVTPKPMVNLYGGGDESCSVVENQPSPRREDVVREDDETPGDHLAVLRRGHARDLAGYWTAPRPDSSKQRISKERLELAVLRQNSAWATGIDAAGAVHENQPVLLEGVVRAGDVPDETLPLERGTAKQLASTWQNRRDENSISREPFRLEMDVNPDAVSVFENQPAQLEGVVRCSEPVREVLGQQGQIRSLAQRYVAPLEDQDAGSLRNVPPPQIIKLDLADGPSVLESVPIASDPSVVRADDNEPDMLKAGLTKNMLHRWQSQVDLEGATGAGPGFGAKPAWQIELEMTPSGSGVFENEPVVRTDVIREDDRDPDMIPVRQTRRTRALWSRREREELEGQQRFDAKTRELVRFTPPRERTPPAIGLDEPYKSVHLITLQSSGSSTPARSETPARGPASDSNRNGGHHQQGTVQSPRSGGGPLVKPLSQTETARTRARIGSEVMEWHARRMSRSISVEENMQSPSVAPETPSNDPMATDDWSSYQNQFQQMQNQDHHYQQQGQQQCYDQSYDDYQRVDDGHSYNGYTDNSYNGNPYYNGTNSSTGVPENWIPEDYNFQRLSQQQAQPEQFYGDDNHQWGSYEMPTSANMTHDSYYMHQTAPPASDEPMYPVTVKSSATVVFRPASNGL